MGYRWIGCKWTIAVSFLFYIPFIAAQFYPRFYTLVPAGLAVGFGGGPLWCAKCTYLTVISEAFSAISFGNIKLEVAIVRFFGLFFIFYQLAQVWGNLLSSTVLSSTIGDVESLSENMTNVVVNASKTVGELCGANFCPVEKSGEVANLHPPDHSKIQFLSGIFILLMLCATVLVSLFTDTLKRYEMGRKGSGSGLSGIKLLAVTFKQLMRKKQIFLLPITMFIGAEQAFMAVGFTASFVGCGWGISRIGYIMIFFGVSNVVAAAFIGAIAKITGRLSIMIVTMVVHAALIIWMKVWVVVENDYLTFATMAALWGLVDGTWLIQINSYYGVLFTGKEEAAFSNFRFFEAIGSVTIYVLNPMFCTSSMLTILLCLMLLGMIGYGSVEYLQRKEERSNNFELQGSER
ncbi:UNC93-like protein [Pseudolycoriella hygida]|uniref:UNC93-like protein n=1 Tax=Pseudolycoriella hygida TaxID=35572 RepID=A0A9Q0RU39_9DIPT|nr:UNC93-like protein [Pseudolycoriella hygida]